MPLNSHIEGTTTPQNFFNEKDYRQLMEKERPLSMARAIELRKDGVIGDFSLDHLKSIHKQLFQDVYPWAGEERTMGIRKGKSLFDPDGTFKNTFASLQIKLQKKNYLQGLPKAEFAKEMASVYSTVNMAHPFLEGNGRATREYMSQLAAVAGFVLEYHNVDKKTWNEAAIASFNGDLKPMEQVFNSIAKVTRAWVYDNYPRERALKACPELAGAYALFDQGREGMKKSTEKAGVEKVFKQFDERLRGLLHSGHVPGASLNKAVAPVVGATKAAVQAFMPSLRM